MTKYFCIYYEFNILFLKSVKEFGYVQIISYLCTVIIKKVIDMEEKILTNNNLQQMGNPMQNLLSTMKNMISQIDVAENIDALEELDKASESIRKALQMVNKNVYK